MSSMAPPDLPTEQPSEEMVMCATDKYDWDPRRNRFLEKADENPLKGLEEPATSSTFRKAVQTAGADIQTVRDVLEEEFSVLQEEESVSEWQVGKLRDGFKRFRSMHQQITTLAQSLGDKVCEDPEKLRRLIKRAWDHLDDASRTLHGEREEILEKCQKQTTIIAPTYQGVVSEEEQGKNKADCGKTESESEDKDKQCLNGASEGESSAPTSLLTGECQQKIRRLFGKRSDKDGSLESDVEDVILDFGEWMQSKEAYDAEIQRQIAAGEGSDGELVE